MASITYKLSKKGLCTPPKWLPDNVQYETVIGSIAYGVSQDISDFDVCGFCIPPKTDVFPHLRGEILGFGRQKRRFTQYQGHHIFDRPTVNNRGRTYDIAIYSIVKYFQLVMENNPNMIDSLYTPQDCILHITQIGQMVRDNRDLFLHKGSWHKFRGYAYSEVSKMENKLPNSNRSPESKRWNAIRKFGYDVKKAYHVVRLVLEVEQILSEGALDLRRNCDVLKAIRNGEWTEQRVRNWFNAKEKVLELLYHTSKLQYKPDEVKIKELLLGCLEQHYGSLSDAIVKPNSTQGLINEIENVLIKYS